MIDSEKMFGVLCESENGLNAFGNAKGSQILMESVGEGLSLSQAKERAETLNKSKKYGRVIIVELKIAEVLF